MRALTYANAMSTIAVFLALGGTAYALSVRSTDIVDATIRGVDVRNGTLLSRDISDGTIQGIDIKNDTLASTDVKNGSLTLDDLTGAAISSYAVDGDGSIYKTQGAAATGTRDSEGTYTIAFGRNVTACMFFATTGYTDGIAIAPEHSALPHASVYPSSETAVTVWTFDSAGPALKDNTFMLLVVC